MEFINEILCKDVCGIVSEFMNGNKQYWKNEFNNVMDDLKEYYMKNQNFHSIVYRDYDMEDLISNQVLSKLNYCYTCHTFKLFENFNHICPEKVNSVIKACSKNISVLQERKKLLVVIDSKNKMDKNLNDAKFLSEWKQKIYKARQENPKYKLVIEKLPMEEHFNNFIFKLL